MSKPESMSKITVLGPQSYKKRAIETLYELGVLHLVDHEKDENFDIGKPLDYSERLSEILVSLRSLISQLELENEKPKKAKVEAIERIEKQTKELVEQTAEINTRRRETSTKINKLKQELSLVESISKLNLDVDALRKSRYLKFSIGYFPGAEDSEALKQILSKITDNYELNCHDENKTWIGLVSKEDQILKLADALRAKGYSEVDVDALGEKMPKASDLKKKIKELIDTEEKDKAKIEHIVSKNKEFILNTEASLTEELEKAQAPLRFGETRSAFMVHGWIPTKEKQKFMDAINKVTNNKVDIEITEATKKDKNIPIKMHNSKIMKPFEFFLRLYSLPKYGEIDPTIWLFITFPLFFGMMLGDVIYGLIVFLICWYLVKKAPSMKDLAKIVMWAAVVSMIFGGIYGEYLGFEYVSEQTGEKLCSIGICLEKTQLHEGGHSEAETEHAAEEVEETTPETTGEASFAAPIGIDILNIGAATPLQQMTEQDPIVMKTTKTPLEEETAAEETTDDGADAAEADTAADNTETEAGTTTDPKEMFNTFMNEGIEEEEEIVDEGTAETTAEDLEGEEHAAEEHEEEAETVYTFPRLIQRTHDKINFFGMELLSVLVIGLICGFIHINASLLVGFANAWAAHGFMEAFFEKISWMIFEAGIILLVLKAIPGMAAAIIILIALVLIYKGEGVQGLIELPAIFSNMASYMRIGAVGLASVGLAVVVNEKLAIPYIHQGGIMLFVGIFVMIAGHIINIALGIIGPFLHSIRLHYVEFFSRFYKGGGLEYEPFGSKDEDNR